MKVNERNHVLEIMRHPSKVVGFISQKLLWEIYYLMLPKPKVKCSLEPNVEQIEASLKEAGYTLLNLEIDENEFSNYLETAQYSKYPNYYGRGKNEAFANKAVQHFVAAKLLALSNLDVFIDVASLDSPVAEIYQRLFGCKAYNQDLIFPEGINGTTIGGDASQMPVSDGFASKMSLHCSLEHFENDSDMKFMQEANRVLKSGGKLCIVPLYLFQSYATLTNPLYAKRKTKFDSESVIYAAKNYYNCHGRFYDVNHLSIRIRDKSNLKMTIYVVNCNLPSWKDKFFAALFEKIRE